MRIDAKAPPLRLELPAPAAPASGAARLTTGQVLQGRVEQQGEQLLLRIADRQLPLPANTRLQPGQSVQLRVEQSGPKAILTLVEEQPKAARELLQQALRQILPQAGARTSLHQPLQQLASQAETQQRLPPELRQALEALLSSAPRARDLQSPEGLRQALQHSGLFTESTLARPQGGQNLGLDLKAAALRLMLQLQGGKSAGSGTSTAIARGAPTGQAGAGGPVNADLTLLLTQTETLLTRVQQLQVHNAGAESGRLDLAMELPVRHDQGLDMLQLRLRQEDEDSTQERDEADGERAGQDGGRAISVRIAFEFQGLGQVQAQLRLRGEHISASWWAERPETVALFSQHQDRLQAQLESLGLTVDALGLQSRRPPGPLDDLHPGARGLLNEKA